MTKHWEFTWIESPGGVVSELREGGPYGAVPAATMSGMHWERKPVLPLLRMPTTASAFLVTPGNRI